MNREPYQQKSRMVEISMSGSGEGRSWVTGSGYSTHNQFYEMPRRDSSSRWISALITA